MQGMAVLSCWVLGALQGAILILIPQMMLQGQLSAMQLAIPLSLGTFIFLYCSGRWGQLLDARCATNKSIISILRWVLFGFLISQLSFILILKQDSFQGVSLVIALCFSRILHGIFCSAIMPTAQLSLSRHDLKGEKIVWASIATNIGRLTAPLLTFVPIALTYFSLWFIFAMTIIAVVIACLNRDNRTTNTNASSLPSLSKVNINSELFSLFTNPLLLSVCISALLISLYSSQLQFSLGPLFLTQFSDAAAASQMTAGLLFTASVSAAISLFVLYRPLSRFPRVFLLVITSSFMIGSALFALQQYLFIAITLISAALSMAPAWYTALAIHSSQHHKARTSAAVTQGHTLGNALGGLMGGLLLLLGQQAILSSFILLMFFILLAWLAVHRQSIRSAQMTNSMMSIP